MNRSRGAATTGQIEKVSARVDANMETRQELPPIQQARPVAPFDLAEWPEHFIPLWENHSDSARWR